MFKDEISNEPGFLAEAYRELDLRGGDLVEVKDIETLDEQAFINKAQWLTLCRYINRNKSFKAESIFFVENNPVVVFVNNTVADKHKPHEIFNQIWCMANPRFLFISTPTELNVYDLANKPVRKEEELNSLGTVTVKEVSEIASILKIFRRESIESGEVFGDKRFGKVDSRADRTLIDNIKTVRSRLYAAGLDKDKLKYAHALIGRSIFIRYLEDRGILTKDYFYQVAEEKPEWKRLLEKPSPKPGLLPEMGDLLYLKVLSDHEFTYKLYEKLAEDFNGDMFPTDRDEKRAVKAGHLLLLQKFLTGEQDQERLFFWAYKFDIIPIELISSIYEELYHSEDLTIHGQDEEGNLGTHYTPASLVEFVLSGVLTIDKLKTNPRVMDPACGSGIFLVEAFRRIVRYQLFKEKNRKLSFQKLENILRNQIRGIELNPEAVRISAFSLYLAFLHYQDPPDILNQIKKGNKLPHLVYPDKNNKKERKKYLDILIRANAFDVEAAVKDKKVIKNFSSGCADIVVGNPPWGKVSRDDEEGNVALKWCESREKTIPDKELSQAFIWRTIDFLRDKGTAALLVKSSIIFRKPTKTNRVKQDILHSICIHEVVNFVHVRHLFFSSAVSPFISIVFKKEIPAPDDYIFYRTARRTKVVENTKAVVLDKNDFKFFKYSDTVTDDIWKIYYFGSRRDQSLISGLRLFPPLKEFEVKNIPRRQGFKESIKDREDAGWLKNYKFLPSNELKRYGPLDLRKKFKPVPLKVREKGTPEIYEGMRILMNRGPTKNDYGEDGHIVARIETETFAFKHSITCIKLESNKEEDYKILLGILWSSLLRYYFFMTSSSWAIWHDQIYVIEVLSLPVAFPKNEQLKKRIIKIVDELRHFESQALGAEKRIKELEMELDDAIFELYMLTGAECDLIRDRCRYDIEYFYKPSVFPIEVGNTSYGTFRSLPADRRKQKGLEGYLYVFLKSLNPEVEEGKELSWQIIHHPTVSMIALVFTLQNKGEKTNPGHSTDESMEWRNILRRLEKETQIPYSSKIYIEGIVRVVTKNQIIIIKRNEERLWTRSAAYEDAEATLLQAMKKENPSNA